MDNKIVVTNDGSHSIFNAEINECYHSKHGAIVEAEHVFIRNGFSAANKSKLNILEVGFGTGLNALLTYQKAVQKSIEVNYQTMELFPVKEEQYIQLNFADLIGLEKKELLILHSCAWEATKKISPYFTLTKKHTSLEKYNSKITFDIIYFDAFSPEKQPELWNESIFRKMHGFLKDEGFLVTYCAKGAVKRTMKTVGFEVLVLDGPPGKRQMTRGNKSVIEK
jgi:tRNA U34 5-methylaminomethyl-2-thiouridine-forming methyltransferase MnmC